MESNHKNIKEALDQRVPNWDDGKMWDSIEKTLPTDRPKRRWIVWLMSGFGIVAIGLLAWWANPMSQQSFDNTERLTELEIESKTVKDDDRIQKADPIIPSAKTQEVNTSNNQLVTEEQERKTLTTTSKKKSQKVELDQEYQANNSMSLAKKQAVDSGLLSQLYLQPVVKANQSKQSYTQEIIQHQRNDLRAGIFLDRLVISDYKQSVEMPTLDLHLSDEKLLQSKSNLLVLPPRHAIATNFGVMKTIRSITSDEHQDWITAKESQEDLLETIDVSIQYQRMIHHNIQLGIGIGYSQVNERLTWRDTVLSAMDTTYTSSIKTVETQYDIYKNETPNAYQTLYIPLSIGYVLSKRKWIYSMNVGGSFSIVSRQRGRLITSDLTHVVDSEVKNDNINKSLGLQSLYTSINGAYQLRDKLYLSAGLRYQIGVQSRLTDQTTNLKYGGYGLQVGLRYQLDQ